MANSISSPPSFISDTDLPCTFYPDPWDNFHFVKQLGAGSFGTVWMAFDKRTEELVAIKKLGKKYYSLDQCLNLPEIKSLRIAKHPNIVQLKEIVVKNHMVWLVFECMECSLSDFIKRSPKPFSESQIRRWCFQVFRGLAYMHDTCGLFHCDLKPGNLLINGDTVKIADLGSVREVDSTKPPTTYGTTRWYRAPEILIPSHSCGSKVDMWAMGAIIAELFAGRPIFRGEDTADQVVKICNVIGGPTSETCIRALGLEIDGDWEFSQIKPVVNLSELIPRASKEAISLISSLCSWDPSKRPTAVEALRHPFFKSCLAVNPACSVLGPELRVNACSHAYDAFGLVADPVEEIIARLEKKGLGYTII